MISKKMKPHAQKRSRIPTAKNARVNGLNCQYFDVFSLVQL